MHVFYRTINYPESLYPILIEGLHFHVNEFCCGVRYHCYISLITINLLIETPIIIYGIEKIIPILKFKNKCAQILNASVLFSWRMRQKQN